MKTEILFDNKWVQLKQMVDKENGVDGYVFSHEKRCGGKIVSILPFKTINNVRTEFLIRHETTPCWGMDKKLSSVTGGVENDNPKNTAVHEIKEECGYIVTESDLIDLGTIRGTKSIDTIYYLYGVDVTNKKKLAIKGDGSYLETQAHNEWYTSRIFYGDKFSDPMLVNLFIRLSSKGIF